MIERLLVLIKPYGITITIFVVVPHSDKQHLPLIRLCDPNKVVGTSQVEFGEQLGCSSAEGRR